MCEFDAPSQELPSHYCVFKIKSKQQSFIFSALALLKHEYANLLIKKLLPAYLFLQTVQKIPSQSAPYFEAFQLKSHATRRDKVFQ